MPGWMRDDHKALAELADEFFAKECAPNETRWAQQQHVDREIWTKAGELGLLCASIPEEYGGGGGDFGHEAAIAMTEPGTGSDLQGIKTTAVKNGDEYVINGSKTFITNGLLCDLVIVAAKTDPDEGAAGVSLIVVENGITKRRKLEKVGQHGQDTCELFFDNVRVPASNLLGEEGQGFRYLMEQLPQERLIIAVPAVASMEKAVELTIAYVKERTAFGKPILAFQNTRFELAECSTLGTVARTFLDDCLAKHIAGELDITGAAKAKWRLTEQQNIVADRCMQLFGGYGYMVEYPIARIWTDSRIQKIYGGTNEIMKEIIGRTL